jgi:hypothetical protein
MALHYREASSVLAKLEARRGGIKSLVFQSDFTNKKLVYAVVAETMKYAQVLQVLLNMLYKQVGYVSSNDGGSDDNDIFAPPNKWLVRVMVYDLLFGSRKAIQGNGAMKLAILRHRTHLEQALTTHMNEVGVKTHTELLPERLRGKGGAKLPRYARVNTLKTTKMPWMPLIQSSVRKPKLNEHDCGMPQMAAALRTHHSQPRNTRKKRKHHQRANKTTTTAATKYRSTSTNSNQQSTHTCVICFVFHPVVIFTTILLLRVVPSFYKTSPVVFPHKYLRMLFLPNT